MALDAARTEKLPLRCNEIIWWVVCVRVCVRLFAPAPMCECARVILCVCLNVFVVCVVRAEQIHKCTCIGWYSVVYGIVCLCFRDWLENIASPRISLAGCVYVLCACACACVWCVCACVCCMRCMHARMYVFFCLTFFFLFEWQASIATSSDRISKSGSYFRYSRKGRLAVSGHVTVYFYLFLLRWHNKKIKQSHFFTR